MESIKQLLEVSAYQPKQGYSRDLINLITADLERSQIMEKWVEKGRTPSSFYNALKALKDSLINYSYQDKNNWSGTRHKRMEVWEKFRCVKLSFIASKDSAALSLAIEVVPLAQRFGFAEIVLSLASDLEHHYGAISPDTRRYLRYRKLRKEYAEKLNDELEAKSLLVHLVFMINKKKGVGDLASDIGTLTTKQQGTAKFMQYRFSALATWHGHFGNAEGVKRTLSETLHFYEHCDEVIPDSAKWSLYFQTVPILIREGKFIEAASLVSKAMQTVSKGTHNWHAFLLQRAEIGLASGKPGIALGALRAAQKAPKEYDNQEIDQEWEKVRLRLDDWGCYR